MSMGKKKPEYSFEGCEEVMRFGPEPNPKVHIKTEDLSFAKIRKQAERIHG